ncbi:GNAT family N-acetyltransferase [Neobacillus dielmonensis]|uniref:GNAT family N-acetyltransferase n=1 Tax=Neobacillus dielmonensis TaxID=1347369 RepID=UPI0005A5DFBD|nr:GNAT family N-acetyltransferase [Neobacillus dielmonensis]
MEVISTDEIDKSRLTKFFIKHWGSPVMVISSGMYQCNELDGFIVVDDCNEFLGLITYLIKNNECEIISLDSIVENMGIGTTLLHQVELTAKSAGCSCLKLVTTNDNLRALEFHQKRGYQLSAIFVNAVETARRIKPEIPFVADNGIPIRDEILLVKTI